MQTLDLFPFTTATHPQTGNLTIAGHYLSDLVRKWGSPLYVYDAETLRALAAGLIAQLKNS
jgi:diaminopimelate decarboxylase